MGPIQTSYHEADAQVTTSPATGRAVLTVNYCQAVDLSAIA